MKWKLFGGHREEYKKGNNRIIISKLTSDGEVTVKRTDRTGNVVSVQRMPIDKIRNEADNNGYRIKE